MLLPMKNNVKLLMVYSRTIESNDTQPIFDRKLLGYPRHEHKCPEELQVHIIAFLVHTIEIVDDIYIRMYIQYCMFTYVHELQI